MSSSVEMKMLYDQHGFVDDDTLILSSMYLLKWTYPGASAPTVTRCRLTCIYTKEVDGSIYVSLGLIEKWGSSGWTSVDEYCDDRAMFTTPAEIREKLESIAKSFFSGIALDMPESLIPEPPEVPTAAKPGLRVISFEDKKTKSEDNSKVKKDDNDIKSKHDDNFDWV